MSETKSSSDGRRRRRRPHDVADGCGVYKYVRARNKLEIDTSAATATAAARIIGHSVAENTTLHGVKHLRRAKGERCGLFYSFILLETGEQTLQHARKSRKSKAKTAHTADL